MLHTIKKVEALYPKLDRPYKFDKKENRSVPCGATDDGAEYTVDLKINYADILPLRKAMKAAYEEKKHAEGWTDNFKDNFKVLEGSVKNKDAVFQVKTKLKAHYSGSVTKKPKQFDAKNNQLPDDFQLTTGSTVNVQVELIPYSGAMGHGASLRLRAVQVIQLAASSVVSPFDVEDGFTSDEGSPFTEEAPKAAVVEEIEDDFDEEPEEPKKVVKKKKVPPKDDGEDLDAIIDEWGDDD